MSLAARHRIRYAPTIRASGTETPHSTDSIQVLDPTARHQLGAGCSRAERAGRSFV